MPCGLKRLATDQLDILSLLAQGLTVDTVARRLDVSERTVRRKVRAIADELGVDSTIEAVVWGDAAASDLIAVAS